MTKNSTIPFFIIRRQVAEATTENPDLLLSLDPNTAGRIVAFLSPTLNGEVRKQLARNPGLSGVLFSAPLARLLETVSMHFESNQAIAAWINELEKSAELLRAHLDERQTFLSSARCDSCGHSAGQHFRPYLGDLACRETDCECHNFSPLVRLQESEAEGSEFERLKKTSFG